MTLRLSIFAALVLGTAGPARGLDSKACAACHRAIYRSYSATSMARSSGLVSGVPFQDSFKHSTFASPGGTAHYSVSNRGSEVSFDFEQGEIKGQRRLDYFIGSGVVGRSYLTNIEGFLYQAPVSYYSSAARWGLSPGYENREELNLVRGVEPACLNCHASGVRAVPATSNGYANPPWLENGVACERCHGPGEEHVTRMKSGSIVNPAKLDAKRRDSVCAQCHLPGAVEIARSGKHGSFKPGDRLSDSVTVFVWADANRETTVNGHFEQLARSACQRASGGKLWCGSCHDPHRVVPEAEKAAFYRSRCFRCHSDSSCTGPPKARIAAANNCMQCHMPREPATTVRHAAFTDHSIPRTPRPNVAPPARADAVLVPFNGFDPGDRELGLAYATLAPRDANRVWGMRAFELLRKVNAQIPADAKVAAQLAQLYDRMGNEEQACDLYARVVASDSTASAAVNLGTCLARQGRMDESIKLWESVLPRNPTLEAAVLNLAVAQYRKGDVYPARATLERALKFNPALRAARDMLRDMRTR